MPHADTAKSKIPGIRNIALAALALLVLALSASLNGCGDDADALDRQRAAEFSEALKEMNARGDYSYVSTVGGLKARDSGKTLIIEKFEIKNKRAETPYILRVANIEIRLKEYPVKSQTSYDLVECRGLTLRSTDPAIKCDLDVDGFTLKDLAFDAREVSAGLNAMSAAMLEEDPVNLMLAFKIFFGSFSYSDCVIAKAVLDMAGQGERYALSIGSYTGKDYSLFKSGPMTLGRTTASYNGKEVFTLDSAGMDGRATPEFWFDMPSRTDSLAELADRFAKTPLTLKNIRLNNLRVNTEDLAFSAATVTLNVDIGKIWKYDFSVTNQILPVARLKADPVVGKLFANYDKDLDINIRNSLVVNPTPEGGFRGAQISVGITEKILGSFEFKAEASLSDALPLSRLVKGDEAAVLSALRVHSLDLTLKDGGFSDLIFAAAADGGNPADVRARIVKEFKTETASAPPAFKGVFAAATDFLAEKGVLSVSMTPTIPVLIARMRSLNPDALGLSATHESILPLK